MILKTNNNILLKSLKGFNSVSNLFRAGKHFKSKDLLIVLQKVESELIQVEFAVIAPKKKSKKAVARNRIKRILRVILLNYFKNSEINFSYKIIIMYNAKVITLLSYH